MCLATSLGSLWDGLTTMRRDAAHLILDVLCLRNVNILFCAQLLAQLSLLVPHIHRDDPRPRGSGVLYAKLDTISTS